MDLEYNYELNAVAISYKPRRKQSEHKRSEPVPNHAQKEKPRDCEALWELLGSNQRPSACKADALNQLS